MTETEGKKELRATTSSIKREILEPGTYMARCYSVVELGTHLNPSFGTKSRKIRVTWELPGEMRVFNEDKGEQPMVISKEYTLSLSEKAYLRADLKSWLLVDDAELTANGYDVGKLIGKPALLTLGVGESKKGVKYNSITSIGALMKNTESPAQINEDQLLYLAFFDVDVYNKLPKFLQEKIQESDEWREFSLDEKTILRGEDEVLPEPVEPEPVPVKSKKEQTDDDDLPF